jgi:3-dehydroquinate synthase
VDAGIGVKNGVNFAGKKSYLGSFHPPLAVLLDPRFLRTLPLQHFQFGLAEMIKIALVSDAELFSLIEAEWFRFVPRAFQELDRGLRQIIELSARRMLEELKDNLFEAIYKRAVDAGHTFSPQIEAASGFTIHHGAAVAIDLSFSTTVAAVAGMLTWNERERVILAIRKIGLPIYSPLLTEALCERALVEVRHHRGGEANLVVPVRIGAVEFVDPGRDFGLHVLSIALNKLRSDYADVEAQNYGALSFAQSPIDMDMMAAQIDVGGDVSK